MSVAAETRAAGKIIATNPGSPQGVELVGVAAGIDERGQVVAACGDLARLTDPQRRALADKLADLLAEVAGLESEWTQ